MLALVDLVLIYGVWVGVVLAYHAIGLGHYDPAFYLHMWPVGLVFVGINSLFRLYHGGVMYPAAPVSPIEELRRLVGASMLTHVGVIAFLAFARQTTEDYSRVVIAASGFLVALLAQPFRDVVRFALSAFDIGRIPVVFAGSGDAAKRVVKAIEKNRYLGFRVVAQVGDDKPQKLVRKAKRRNVRILVTCQDLRLFQCRMETYARWFTHVEYLPSARMFPVLGARAITFDGLGGLEMISQRQMKALRIEKWMLDKGIALLLFLGFLPFFAMIGALIKLTSRGPVFYRQERLGKDGNPIRVWKFRSMYMDATERLKHILSSDPAAAAEWEKDFKLKKDPRVTPLGRFLRRTSIDELPQLFNVFAGEMAVIGPRPIVQEEVCYYGDSYKVFSSVLPGITGLWQVSGRSDTGYERRVELDTYYVLNWSPWMDIWILLRTVWAVVSMHGAR
ncbi:MAG: exopolysaccharide biosynthesis polyprenyl glycosylphosphotransferase [Clostridia bacterium]|nr:exopolysaccharide biosynthesis polyprenyl glycosylphosphotransferase [Clostridia bacterium]